MFKDLGFYSKFFYICIMKYLIPNLQINIELYDESSSIDLKSRKNLKYLLTLLIKHNLIFEKDIKTFSFSAGFRNEIDFSLAFGETTISFIVFPKHIRIVYEYPDWNFKQDNVPVLNLEKYIIQYLI